MPLVKVKDKFQVTLPTEVRQRAGVAVGDILEAKVQGHKITLTPKVLVDRAVIDRRLAEGLGDLRAGRSYGPFASAKETVRSLHKAARRLKKR